MKKTSLFAVIFAFFSSIVFADLHPMYRNFETSVLTTVGFSNNFLNINKLLDKHIVIDLGKFKNLSKDGWDIGVNLENEIKFTFNKIDYRISFFNRLEGMANINIDKGIFDYLFEGNIGKKDESFKVTAYGDVFDEIGVSLLFKSRDSFCLHITPSFYIPLLYIPKTSANARIVTTDMGLNAKISTEFNVYSAVNLDDSKSSEIHINEIINNAGFSLATEFEKRFGDVLDLGLYTTIPMVPGKLKYVRHQKYDWELKLNNPIGAIDGDELYETEKDNPDAEYSSANMKFYRPLTFGLEAGWQPIGTWLTFKGLLGMKMKDPYDSDLRIVFPEYDFGARVGFARYLSFSLDAAYKNKIFIHSFDFMVSIRLVEFDFGLMLQGSDFLRTFETSGFGAFIGLKAGW